MKDILYQIHYPWHWLTYGQNATAAGIVGLFFYTFFTFLYTFFTWKTMKFAEESRRATMTPIFSLREFKEEATGLAYDRSPSRPEVVEFNVVADVRNIGDGPAVGVHGWYQPVSEKLRIDSSFLIKPKHAEYGTPDKTELMKGELGRISFAGIRDLDRRWLFVIQSTDAVGGQHQLKILWLANANQERQVVMGHRLGLTFGERVVRLAERLVEIVEALRKTLAKLRTTA